MYVLCNKLSDIAMNPPVEGKAGEEESGGYQLYFQRMISEICSRRMYDVFLTGVSNALGSCCVMFGLPLVICLTFDIQVLNLNNGIVLFGAACRDSVKDCIVMKTSEQNTLYLPPPFISLHGHGNMTSDDVCIGLTLLYGSFGTDYGFEVNPWSRNLLDNIIVAQPVRRCLYFV